jgi:putative ABC transport system permease protein
MLDEAKHAAVAAKPAHTRRRLWWWPSISLRLALRNLARDRVRLAITVIGITFSVVLMALQTALLIGFAVTSSSIVDHSPADFWIVPKGTRNVDQTGDIGERSRYRALALPGVASATKLIVRFLPWKRPDGGVEAVIVIGVDPQDPGVLPWSMEAGSAEGLKLPDGIIIDRLYAQKLGITRLGETAEVNGHRGRVVGFTQGIRTFTQAPYIFAAFKTAQTIAEMDEDRTSYVLVTARDGADLGQLRQALVSRFPEYDVWDRQGFSAQTREYWLLTTGAGAALVIAAILGLVVGIIIVAQTLYAATMERIKEYATLRAMGAGNAYLRGVILKQSCMSAGLGYAIGMVIALAAIGLARDGAAAMILPVPMVFALALVTFAMCSCGALISVRTVLRIDPAIVFK